MTWWRPPSGARHELRVPAGRRSPRRPSWSRPRPWSRGPDGGEYQRGSVLLEAAIAIPLLLAVAFCLGWAVSLAGTTMALGDAAREAAREMARGTAVNAALDAAQAAAPGAALQIERDDDSVVVVAEQQVSAPGPILNGISVTLHQRVAVPIEWSEGLP